MKRSIVSVLFAVAALVALPASIKAQTAYGGAVLDHDIMMPADFAQLSQTRVFGTARSMAMGGAFTSLGGDISAVAVNPAGLGMFSQGVVSFTPMLTSTNASTTGVPSWVGNNKTSFGFSSLGAVINLSESASGSLIALNAAITYTRIADYNSRMSFSSENTYNSSSGDIVPSIVDVFNMQLAGASIYPGSNDNMDYADNPYYWPAQGAYKTYLSDPTSDGDGWTTNVIGHNASVLSSYDVLQKGRADEYSFALGGNIANALYFGVTLGVQDIRQTTQYAYQEEYNYYEAGDNGFAYGSAEDTLPLDYQASYAHFLQTVKLDGSGVNLKLGLTARPIRALRVAVAFHTPTYYSLARSYQVTTESTLLGNYTGLPESVTYYTTSPEMLDNYEYSWDFRTPAKLLAGASLQVGSFGIISLDYERQWYNWIRVSSAPGELTPYQYQQSYEEYYKPTNTIRAGLEIKPLPVVALRVGGGVSSSMLKNESQMYSTPIATDSHYITCGVGFSFSATTSLDLAYQFYHQDYTPYRLFYAEDGEGIITGSALFDTSMNYNYFAATLTFRL